MVSLLDEFMEEGGEFRPDGFNGRIPMFGGIGNFWECPMCGNATEYRPEFCVKCNFIHFERMVHRSLRIDRFRDSYEREKALYYG